jgi:hypothetical protein
MYVSVITVVTIIIIVAVIVMVCAVIIHTGKPPLHEDTRVLIRVGVPGNQRPIFRGNRNVGNGPSGYAATVQENAEPGTEVVQVIATDPDGQDSRLNYFIAGGARDNFVINQRF